MIIKDAQVGDTKHVTLLGFGTGDIYMKLIESHVGTTSPSTQPNVFGLAFQHRPPGLPALPHHEVKPEVAMTFSTVESIDFVIDNLKQVKRLMLKASNSDGHSDTDQITPVNPENPD